MSNMDLPEGYTLDPAPAATPPQAAAPPAGFTLDAPPPHKFGLADTWPAQIAKSLWDAATLPGDVMAGKVQLPSSQGGVPGSVGPTEGDAALSRVDNAAIWASPTGAALRGGEGAAGALTRTAPRVRDVFGGPKVEIGPVSVDPATQAAQTAANLGAPLPRGLASPSTAIQAVTQAARALPVVGAKIDKAAANTVGAAGDAVNSIATDLSGGVTDRASAGAILRPSLQGIIENNNGKIDDAFSSLRGMLDQSEATELPQTSAVLKAIVKERANAGKINPLSGLEDVGNMTQTGSTFDGLQRARSDIGNQIKFGQANPGFNGGDLKRIYAAMSGDMDSVVRQSVKSGVDGEAASTALRQANATASPLIELNSKLQRLTASPSGEGLVGSLVNAAQNKNGNVQLLAQLRNSMAPEDFSHISGVALSELGHNPTTGTFSLNKFATGWDKLSPQAKSVMFAPQHRAFLDDIAQLGFHLKNAEQYANRSQTALGTGLRTALATATGAVGSLALTGDIMPIVSALGAAGGGYALAGALSRPATAATLAKWSRAALNYSTTPSVATRATLKIATQNLRNSFPQRQDDGGAVQ